MEQLLQLSVALYTHLHPQHNPYASPGSPGMSLRCACCKTTASTPGQLHLQHAAWGELQVVCSVVVCNLLLLLLLLCRCTAEASQCSNTRPAGSC